MGTTGNGLGIHYSYNVYKLEMVMGTLSGQPSMGNHMGKYKDNV